MKKILLNKRFVPVILITAVLFTACQKKENLMYDQAYKGIYFLQDSIYYSFGVTPLGVTQYVLNVPVKVMGISEKNPREFKVEVVASNTTAQVNQHYTLPGSITVAADSVNAVVPVTIIRTGLGDLDYKLSLRLVSNNEFVPTNDKLKETTLHFNNRVERPNWRDFRGNLTWPTSQLGPWNPLTYIKFIELFRELENIAPSTYDAMVAEFGVDLANLTGGWPWDYDYTMRKYIRVPLYEYFLANPQYGITIPNPY